MLWRNLHAFVVRPSAYDANYSSTFDLKLTNVQTQALNMGFFNRALADEVCHDSTVAGIACSRCTHRMFSISSLHGSGGFQNQFLVSRWIFFRSLWSTHILVIVALLPYMVFSLFHGLTFLRTTVLPRVMSPPPPPPGTSPGTPQQSSLAKGIQTWVKCMSRFDY
jgi:hypothetical protein